MTVTIVDISEDNIGYDLYKILLIEDPTYYELLNDYGFSNTTFIRTIRKLNHISPEKIEELKKRLYNKEFCMAIENFMYNKVEWYGKTFDLLELLGDQIDKKYSDLDYKQYDMLLDMNPWMFSHKSFVVKLFSCNEYLNTVRVIDYGYINKNLKETRMAKIIRR